MAVTCDCGRDALPENSRGKHSTWCASLAPLTCAQCSSELEGAACPKCSTLWKRVKEYRKPTAETCGNCGAPCVVGDPCGHCATEWMDAVLGTLGTFSLPLSWCFDISWECCDVSAEPLE